MQKKGRGSTHWHAVLAWRCHGRQWPELIGITGTAIQAASDRTEHTENAASDLTNPMEYEKGVGKHVRTMALW